MIPRLFVDEALCKNQLVELSRQQAHYLANVLRRKLGDVVLLFNGVDGQWRAELQSVGKKNVTVQLLEQLCEQRAEPDIALYFAPIKLGRIDYLVEKATELGVRYLQPVMTARTQMSRIKLERLQANALEAAEQCERLTVPPVTEMRSLTNVIADWDESRQLIVCDETGGGAPILTALKGVEIGASLAVLIGPEGGFSDEELEMLRALPYVVAVSLGPRVLRAETAALAALTAVQAAVGDWQEGRPEFNAR